MINNNNKLMVGDTVANINPKSASFNRVEKIIGFADEGTEVYVTNVQGCWESEDCQRRNNRNDELDWFAEDDNQEVIERVRQIASSRKVVMGQIEPWEPKRLTAAERKQALTWYAQCGYDLITIAQHFGMTRNEMAAELRTT